MPISKIVLDNQSKENVDLDGQFVRVPHGTTAQRPSSPAAGQLRFNTDLGTLEQYNTNTNVGLSTVHLLLVHLPIVVLQLLLILLVVRQSLLQVQTSKQDLV